MNCQYIDELSRQQFVDRKREGVKAVVTRLFSSQINAAFTKMRKLADDGKECSIEFNVTYPDQYTTAYVTHLLRSYFENCGYCVIISDRSPAAGIGNVGGIVCGAESDRNFTLTLRLS